MTLHEEHLSFSRLISAATNVFATLDYFFNFTAEDLLPSCFCKHPFVHNKNTVLVLFQIRRGKLYELSDHPRL